MNSFGISEQSLLLIFNVLRTNQKIKQAVIFGSRAKGNYKSGSDIDLALKGDLNQKDITDLTVELNERLPIPYKVDLVLYDSDLHTELKEHIDRVGVEFWSPEKK
ncbi:MAG: nucleotidyltransferase domain-containing protein [Crocinitomicaceae bacterium]|nr:nucleotidyltransferase domain-containing protein [Crocinitomicaceae bacterium]